MEAKTIYQNLWIPWKQYLSVVTFKNKKEPKTTKLGTSKRRTS